MIEVNRAREKTEASKINIVRNKSYTLPLAIGTENENDNNINKFTFYVHPTLCAYIFIKYIRFKINWEHVHLYYFYV